MLPPMIMIMTLLFMDLARSASATCNSLNISQITKLICSEFSSWSELNEELSSNKYAYLPGIIIYLKPSEPIPLTSEFNISLVAHAVELHLFDVSGVYVFPWPANLLDFETCSGCSKIILYLRFSSIEFYVNSTQPGGCSCTPSLIPNNSATTVSSFSTYFNSIDVDFGNAFNSRAETLVCPYLFNNAQINNGMSFGYQVDSFLFVSLFKFQEDIKSINNTSKTLPKSINSIIGSFGVSGYNYRLDTGLVHPLVFEAITHFSCEGTIQSIQTNLFNHFQQLTTYYISMNSLGNFFHQIGIEWMNYLKSTSSVTLISSPIVYNYPDRDFCIFALFPQNLSIILQLPYQNFTLTYGWLCANGAELFDGTQCYNKWNMSNDQFDAQLNLCDLKRKNGTKTEKFSTYPSYTEQYRIKVLDMLFIDLVPFVLIPCACLMGIFFNRKIIQTIKKNKKKKLKEDFYQYMSVNAKFNCIYCLIFVFYPMTSCNWRPNYNFCSSIFTSQLVQYYKIIMIAYFGEVVKMCANISYLMMTLNRYLLVGRSHASWLVSLAKLEFKWVIRGSFFFSLLINIGHGWEYKAVENTALVISSQQYAYDILNGLSFSDYPQANQDMPYFIYSIAYFVINFGVFFILNTGLEIKLVRRMQKELKEKRERLAAINTANGAFSSFETTTAFATAPYASVEVVNLRAIGTNKEENDLKKERKLIKMVIINGILNFALRMPDMLFWLEYKTVYQSFPDYVLFCISSYVPGFVSFILDVSYLTYIFTFTTNFVIFYNFNLKFKEALNLDSWTKMLQKNQNKVNK
jgi:hypothetical protein